VTVGMECSSWESMPLNLQKEIEVSQRSAGSTWYEVAVKEE
jgi:hypothetical protein